MNTGPTLKEQQLAWAIAWQDHGDRAALGRLCHSLEGVVIGRASDLARGNQARFEELCAEFRLAVVEAANLFDRERPDGFKMLCRLLMRGRAYTVIQHETSPATMPKRVVRSVPRVAVVGDDEGEEVASLVAPEAYSEGVPGAGVLQDAVDTARLTAKEWRALQRHLRDETQEQLAELWGCTEEAVQHHERSARAKVKRVLQAKGLSLEDLL